jgi:iron complex transport system ATP-binding protein
MDVITMEKGGFRYSRENWIFRNLSLSVGEGEILSILGPNGKGKTTLLKTIQGVLPLSEGSILRGGSVGYVPQIAAVSFGYTVLDMVVMGRSRHIGLFNSPREHDFSFARSCLERLGLETLADRPFRTLSGGERQMVLIARALASECRCLVLDEPASALDFRNQNTMLRTLQSLRDEGMTVIMSTHVPHHANVISDRALLLFSPEEHLFGDCEDVLVDENLRRLYGADVRRISFSSGGRGYSAVVPLFS